MFKLMSCYYITETLIGDYNFEFFKNVKTVVELFKNVKTVVDNYNFRLNIKTIVINYSLKKNLNRSHQPQF